MELLRKLLTLIALKVFSQAEAKILFSESNLSNKMAFTMNKSVRDHIIEKDLLEEFSAN